MSIEQAARNVAAGASENDVTLFEMFLTDAAGHSQDTEWARDEAVRTDRFLQRLVRSHRPTRAARRRHERPRKPRRSQRSDAHARPRPAPGVRRPRGGFHGRREELARRGARVFSPLRTNDTVPRMTDAATDPKYLEMFPAWLRTLGEDAGALGAIVAGDALRAGEALRHRRPQLHLQVARPHPRRHRRPRLHGRRVRPSRRRGARGRSGRRREDGRARAPRERRGRDPEPSWVPTTRASRRT